MMRFWNMDHGDYEEIAVYIYVPFIREKVGILSLHGIYSDVDNSVICLGLY